MLATIDAMKILLHELSPGDAGFLEEALLARGHELAQAGSEADLTIVDLGAALREGMISGGGARPGGVREGLLWLISPFPRLLAPFAQQADATLRSPITAEALDAALRGERPAGGGEGAFDWAGHDRALASAGLDQAADAELSRVAELVARGTRAPIGLVTLVDSSRQHFLGHAGLPDDLRLAGGTPRSWAFCEHVVEGGAPLVVSDAREQPPFSTSALVDAKLVRAYAGVPVRLSGVGTIGAMCVLSDEPRAFSPEDLATLELGARLVEATLESRPRGGLAARPSAQDESLVGAVLDGRYLVTAPLGEGGSSQVYLARERALGHLVAIKVMRKGRGDDEMLLREAQAIASLRHPSIVQVHGWGQIPEGAPGEGRLFVVLEYVRGRLLSEVLSERAASGEPLPRRQALAVLRDLSGALETMHSARLVHGDVKPGNVILDEALSRAVLIDFGLVMREKGDGATGALHGGTPGYSAPEQLEGSSSGPSPAFDVYSLGALAYALLTGRGPFASLRGIERIRAQRRGDLVPASSLRPELPRTVDVELARSLSPDPSARHATVSELVDALARSLEGASGQAWYFPPGEPMSLGEAFSMARRAVALELGEAADWAALARLPEHDREALLRSTEPREHYAARPLVAYLDAAFAGDLAALERAGFDACSSGVPDVLAALQIRRSPLSVVRALRPLIHRLHAWGRFSFEPVSSAEARVILELPQGFAPVMCSVFAGALRALVALAARDASVEHVACTGKGDEACVLRARWSR